MGMYTELVLGVNLKKDTPKIAVDALRHMMGHFECPEELPDHPFFKTERWDWMLNCSSYNFAGFTQSEMRWDELMEEWRINIRCNLKNYDDEIEQFWDWVMPYVDDGGFAGYKRFEEDDKPALLFVKDEEDEEKCEHWNGYIELGDDCWLLRSDDEFHQKAAQEYWEDVTWFKYCPKCGEKLEKVYIIIPPTDAYGYPVRASELDEGGES